MVGRSPDTCVHLVHCVRTVAVDGALGVGIIVVVSAAAADHPLVKHVSRCPSVMAAVYESKQSVAMHAS